MKLEEVLQHLSAWKEDLSIYKAYWQKARGQEQADLEKKYREVKNMIDSIQKRVNNIETGITEEDFEC